MGKISDLGKVVKQARERVLCFADTLGRSWVGEMGGACIDAPSATKKKRNRKPCYNLPDSSRETFDARAKIGYTDGGSKTRSHQEHPRQCGNWQRGEILGRGAKNVLSLAPHRAANPVKVAFAGKPNSKRFLLYKGER